MADFFKYVPNVKVRIKNQRQNNVSPYVVAKNIFRRVKLIDKYEDFVLGFQQYTVPNGARPDNVAYEFYQDANYDWVVLICNNIVNLYKEWPLSEDELYRYTKRLYGDVDGIHHYETLAVYDDYNNVLLPEGLEVNSDFRYYRPDGTAAPNVVIPITNYEYERGENEKKENIWLLRPAYVEQFVEEFRSLVAYSPNDEIDEEGVKVTWKAVEETFVTYKDVYKTRYGLVSSMEFASQQDLTNKQVVTEVTESGETVRTVSEVSTAGVNASGVIAGTTDASSTSSGTQSNSNLGLGYT